MIPSHILWPVVRRLHREAGPYFPEMFFTADCMPTICGVENPSGMSAFVKFLCANYCVMLETQLICASLP